jgi:hypothetical protein
MSNRPRSRGRFPISHRRSGQALIEFAFVSIVMVTLFTVAFSLGLMLLQSMVTANAGASAGRILHHHPRLSPEAFALMRKIDGVPNEFDIANPTASEIMRLVTADFTGSADPLEVEFTDRFGIPLYDERRLVLTREQYNTPAELPELNRLLLPNFIYDADRDRFRYPGAVVERDISVFGDNALTVLVPLTEGIVDSCFDTGDCSEYDPDALTFWLPPLRICKISNSCNVESNTMPIDLRADGTFAITITFPAQAGALVEFRPVRDGGGNIVEDEFGNEIRTRVVADDSALTNLSTLPTGYTLAPVTSNTDFASLSTRGDYGLGELAVLDMSQEPFEPIVVRPYRRVIGHTSTFRLGQRFEALRQLGATDAADMSPLADNMRIPFSLTGSGMGNFNHANIIATDSAELTIPVQGKWRVSAAAQVAFPTAPIDGNLSLWVYRYDAIADDFVEDTLLATTSVTSNVDVVRIVSGSLVLSLDEGDRVEIRISQDSGQSDAAIVNSATTNWISIESVFVKGGHFLETP